MRSLKQQLQNHLEANEGWHAKGNLTRMEWRNDRGTLYSAENVVRRLRELAEDGVIGVEHRKGHTHYSSKAEPKPRFVIEKVMRDGVEVAVQRQITS